MFSSLKIWNDLARISVESQVVIGLRTACMMGLVDCPAGEQTRMVIEKQEAMISSLCCAAEAAMCGRSANEIVDAAIRPIGMRTQANAERLMRIISR